MAIRLAAKALVIHDGKILLNQCRGRNKRIYYAFPGGGQNPGETLEEAVAREVLEETGLSVRFERFVALYEEIMTDPVLQARYPEHFHKSYHFCRCSLIDRAPETPQEMDQNQEASVWIPLETATSLPLYPARIRQWLPTLVEADAPMYLGCDRD